MNSYENAVALGWIMIIIGFFGALVSNYNFYTIFLLPIFLLIILCGMIVWYYAVKGRKNKPAKIWSAPQTLSEMGGIVAVGNIILWLVIMALRIIITADSTGSWVFAFAFLAFTLFIYIIFGVFYIVLGMKIKKANENAEKEMNLV
ncbi:hypothetical protein MmiHf6_06940 [Methanimicrococcus hongohii]|uniref:Uncharacterized protein n=1 Tax=Methanimicrococcus hongohii TaxID=3028295 RepID=A0AA96VAF7_9EURY|nr:hypothetical protein [Methanimicrococcus sp. Hf6]WNY23387.1 hypothetical protein MmiHf6_06940 [Methanimicrococcus sp. Hf6]